MVGEGLLTAQGLALLSGGSSSRVYTIVARGRVGNDVTRIVRCLVDVSGSGEKGVKMLEWLDKAVGYHDTGLAEIGSDILFTNIRSDPRWLPFLRKIGRAPDQLAKIEFKVAASSSRLVSG